MAGTPDRHAREPERGLSARPSFPKGRSGASRSASRRASTSTRLRRSRSRRTCLRIDPQGDVHAREHVLPRGPGQAGRRREAPAPRRRRLRQAGHAGRWRDPRRGQRLAHAAGAAVSESHVAIQIRGLTKRYGAIEAVRGIDFDVQAGEIFGLIGPDGAGKTSTFQILAGVMEATSGSAELFGRPAREARAHIGYLTQAFSLYPDLTVRGEPPLRRRPAPRAAPRDRAARRALPRDVRHGPLHRSAGRPAERRHEAEARAGLRARARAAGPAARRADHRRRSGVAPRVLGRARPSVEPRA